MASPQLSDDSRKDYAGVIAEPLTSAVRTTSRTSSVDVDEFGHLTLWQAIRKWNRLFWYSLAISTTILMFGYDFVVVGNSSSMPAFQYVYICHSPLRSGYGSHQLRSVNTAQSCHGSSIANPMTAANITDTTLASASKTTGSSPPSGSASGPSSPPAA